MLLLQKFRCQVRLPFTNFLKCKLLSSNEWVKSCTFNEKLLEKLVWPRRALLFEWASGDNDWNGPCFICQAQCYSVHGGDIIL
jgi:hypothetical protein